MLKHKITKLSSENVNLEEDVRTAQESLRLSSNQQQKLNKEIVSLNDDIRNAQDNLRLSANQMAKMKNELKVVQS